jgi:hercynylcysteine S-oxide lyase
VTSNTGRVSRNERTHARAACTETSVLRFEVWSICLLILHLQGCDYPAIVRYESAKSLFQRELPQEERSVRGAIVLGLTAEDVKLMDIFQGNVLLFRSSRNTSLVHHDMQAYSRQTVVASPLASFTPLLHSDQTIVSAETSLPQLKGFTQVQIYVWRDSLELLSPDIWSFDVFVREKLWHWVGRGSSDDSAYALVDEHRALHVNDTDSRSTGIREVNQPPEFGHALLSQFALHPNYVNLNHGNRPVWHNRNGPPYHGAAY